MFDNLKRFVPPNKKHVLIEIGCGTAGNLKLFEQHYQTFGIDISQVAVQFASKRVSCPVILGDFREVLAEKWHEIDAVVLADILEHIKDDKSFLKHIIQHLKPHAVILITVPAHQWLWSGHDLVLGHQRRYSSQSLRTLWRDLPVRERFFSPFNWLLSPAIISSKLVRRFFKGNDESDLYLPYFILNSLLYKIFGFERRLLRMFPLPWGISHLAVLEKGE